MTRSLLSADHVLGKEMSTSDVCFACLAAWLYQLFVGTLISLTNAYADCGTPALNFTEHFDLGRSVPDREAGFILFAVITLPSKTFATALKELSRMSKQSRELRRLDREHISKNIPKSSKIHDYTCRAHVLRDFM